MKGASQLLFPTGQYARALSLSLSPDTLAHPVGTGPAPPPRAPAQVLPSDELPQDRLSQVSAPPWPLQHDPEGCGWQPQQVEGDQAAVFSAPSVAWGRTRRKYTGPWSFSLKRVLHFPLIFINQSKSGASSRLQGDPAESYTIQAILCGTASGLEQQSSNAANQSVCQAGGREEPAGPAMGWNQSQLSPQVHKTCFLACACHCALYRKR